MKVLVIGAGIGGLGAAVALRSRGFDVDVVEIKADASVHGVGISQPANGLRALRTLGVLDDVLAAGFRFDHADFHDADGELIAHVPIALGDAATPARIALSRGDLHKILGAAAERYGVTVRYGTTVESFAERDDANPVGDDADGVVDDGVDGAVDVTFGDRRQERYDLIAAFDGIHSATRRRLFGPGYDAAYSGFGVFRVSLPRPAGLAGAPVYQALGVKAGFMPLSAAAMYMYLVVDDPEGVVHEPARFPGIMRERMAPFAADSLPGRIRDGLGAEPAGIVWSPISDVTLPLPWFRGRVGVLGDAAHACAPHLAQGAAMALEDAVVLAEELAGAGPLAERLDRFQRRRFPRVTFVQDTSHAILAAEMKIDASNHQAAYADMRAHLPEQLRRIDRRLDEPA